MRSYVHPEKHPNCTITRSHGLPGRLIILRTPRQNLIATAGLTMNLSEQHQAAAIKYRKNWKLTRALSEVDTSARNNAPQCT